MSFLDSIRISASGLSAQRTRMNIISANLANVNTTRTSEGGPYVRRDVVFASRPVEHAFQGILESNLARETSGVEVAGIVRDQRPLPTKYDPGHPDADEDGYVKMPNVNTVEEMVNLISATRSYEANIAALGATKSMIIKALEIGGS